MGKGAKAIVIQQDYFNQPMFIKQTRIGKDSKGLVIYKLRTMNELTYGDKTRQTHSFEPSDYLPLSSFVRRFWIDEFPQIINVLKGEMSIVGLRPVLHSDLKFMNPEYKELLLNHKPGIISVLYSKRGVKSAKENVVVAQTYFQKRSKNRVVTDLVYLAKAYYNALTDKRSI